MSETRSQLKCEQNTHYNNMEIFIKRLREAMEQKKMSHLELATKLSVTRGTVTNIVLGRANPSFQVFVKICQVLNESADYLLGFTDL